MIYRDGRMNKTDHVGGNAQTHKPMSGLPTFILNLKLRLIYDLFGKHEIPYINQPMLG